MSHHRLFRSFLLGVSGRELSATKDSSTDIEDDQGESLSRHERDETGDSLVDIAAMIEEDSRETDTEPNQETDATSADRPGLDAHPDERQVELDTRRSFVYYPPNLHIREKKRLQEELNEVIVTVLRKRKALSYFQASRPTFNPGSQQLTIHFWF